MLFSLLGIAIPCIQLFSVVCSGKCYRPDSSSQFWLLPWPFLLCGQMNRSCCFPQTQKYVLPSPLFLIFPCCSPFVLQLRVCCGTLFIYHVYHFLLFIDFILFFARIGAVGIKWLPRIFFFQQPFHRLRIVH